MEKIHQLSTVDSTEYVKLGQVRGQRSLTCHLAQTADEESLVVSHVEWDTVTQCLLLVVFDLVLWISVRHAQKILLQ